MTWGSFDIVNLPVSTATTAAVWVLALSFLYDRTVSTLICIADVRYSWLVGGNMSKFREMDTTRGFLRETAPMINLDVGYKGKAPGPLVSWFSDTILVIGAFVF